LAVLGRVVDSQWSALDPSQMGLGPVHAMGQLLQKCQLDGDDIDYWEINEAFAAQVLACQVAWRDEAYMRHEVGMERLPSPIPDERLNVDGGAVSIGHPVGASGARLILHLLKTLQHNKARRGIASLCIGGGQGGAMLVEAVQ
ncbi:MAG: acetyl-CoA C-acyltransferase, partial [Candidatus Thiodiazotropha sp.]